MLYLSLIPKMSDNTYIPKASIETLLQASSKLQAISGLSQKLSMIQIVTKSLAAFLRALEEEREVCQPLISSSSIFPTVTA